MKSSGRETGGRMNKVPNNTGERDKTRSKQKKRVVGGLACRRDKRQEGGTRGREKGSEK
jgi:hypothetical protein